jgi:hypothetical protein
VLRDSVVVAIDSSPRAKLADVGLSTRRETEEHRGVDLTGGHARWIASVDPHVELVPVVRGVESLWLGHQAIGRGNGRFDGGEGAAHFLRGRGSKVNSHRRKGTANLGATARSRVLAGRSFGAGDLLAQGSDVGPILRAIEEGLLGDELVATEVVGVD